MRLAHSHTQVPPSDMAKNRELEWLEWVSSWGHVLFALNQTLLQHESLRAGSLQAPYTTEDLIKHYNCGDLNAVIFNHDTSQLPNFINTTLPPHEQVTAQEIDSYFRQELIYKRNERMGKRVMALLKENTDKSFFFAFGAGHFLGNNTVIDVLRQAGFEVEHIPAGQRVDTTYINLPSRGSSTTDIPAMNFFEHVQPSSSSMPPPSSEEDSLPPHLLLPDSISQLEEFGRQKKWHKRQYKNHRQRQFNDLWVRIEDGTTTMPSPIRITNGYISVNPSIWFTNQLDQQPPPDLAFHHHLKSSDIGSTIASPLTVSICVAMTSFLLHLLIAS
ncbi:hypothetical protein JRQ81_014928 [Phrynocephalus forsythii]|uniref:Metalloprotease TIKI n=1 Tax=Phrynocephalus forsythii TaxID=171643 RepID=A0A9Q0XXL6_9SAUR|nr:hypothetical protein JRQ81_014928 [Phrynocephalus forsythii]